MIAGLTVPLGLLALALFGWAAARYVRRRLAPVDDGMAGGILGLGGGGAAAGRRGRRHKKTLLGRVKPPGAGPDSTLAIT